MVVLVAAKYEKMDPREKWRAICEIGAKIEAGQMKPYHLDHLNEDGSRKWTVSRSTMLPWLRDDAEVMRERGHRGGVEGAPHWRIERDQRRRTQVDETKSGPNPILGAAEELLMLEIGSMARKNTPYAESEIEDLLRETAIRLN